MQRWYSNLFHVPYHDQSSTTGWFKVVELPTMTFEKYTGKIIKTSEIFNKTAKTFARLVNQLWFSRKRCPRFVI